MPVSDGAVYRLSMKCSIDSFVSSATVLTDEIYIHEDSMIYETCR